VQQPPAMKRMRVQQLICSNSKHVPGRVADEQ
jgi:hypothetical protein